MEGEEKLILTNKIKTFDKYCKYVFFYFFSSQAIKKKKLTDFSWKK